MGEAKLEQAVRLDDKVEHSRAFLGAVLGFIGGALLGLFVFGTGGLGALLLVAATAVYFSNVGEKALKNVKYEAGDVSQGSPNVFIGDPRRNAARVKDIVRCHDEPIVSGCLTIYINTLNATRVNESTRCDGTLKTGCESVYFGGESVQVMPKRWSGELPGWFYWGREALDLITFFAPSGPADPSKWWRMYDRASRVLTYLDKGLGYAGGIAQQLGYYDAARAISNVTDHPAYVWTTTAFGGIGVARSLRGGRPDAGGGPPPPGGDPPGGGPPGGGGGSGGSGGGSGGSGGGSGGSGGGSGGSGGGSGGGGGGSGGGGGGSGGGGGGSGGSGGGSGGSGGGSGGSGGGSGGSGGGSGGGGGGSGGSGGGSGGSGGGSGGGGGGRSPAAAPRPPQLALPAPPPRLALPPPSGGGSGGSGGGGSPGG